MTLPHILTLTEAADFLGVASSDVAEWAMDGHLPVCARSESGELLFYRWRVERDGPKLAAGERVRIVKPRKRARAERHVTAGSGAPRDRRVVLHDGHRLACGCVLAGNAADRQPAWLCPTARTLQTVEKMMEMLAAAAPPENLLFDSLAQIAGTALAKHFTQPNATNSSEAAA